MGERMERGRRDSRRLNVVTVLSSLAAEGTPRLVLDLCRIWQRGGIRPVVALLQARPDDLVPDFDRLGIERVYLGMDDSGYRRYGRVALGLFRLARRYRADALLSMPLGWHAFLGAGARLGGVRRVVAHVGNYPPHGAGMAFRKFRCEVQAGRQVTDRLVCCSHYVQAGVVRHFGVPAPETTVIYNACAVGELAERSAQARRARTARGFVVGMVARLEQHKDQPTLIRAARRLADRGAACRVQLVGEGSRRGELEQLIAAERLGGAVELLGMRRDIPELLGQIDLFVFSTTPSEGLGIALIEAMAAGVPVVASDVGACREVLDGGELGLLVPPGNPAALADAIERVRSEPEAAAARARRAQRKAFDVFDAERMADAYAEVLGLKAPAAPRSKAA
jgi:glycosyltransferase involved in cell wall biosynthesis